MAKWCVIQHAEHGGAVVAEAALAYHEAQGWQRTSDWAGDWSDLNPANYPLPQPPEQDQDKPARPARSSEKKGA